MLQEFELERAVRYLISVYGDWAGPRAEKRASDLTRAGDGDAAGIWRSIAGKIGQGPGSNPCAGTGQPQVNRG